MRALARLASFSSRPSLAPASALPRRPASQNAYPDASHYRNDINVLIVGAEVEALACAVALRRFGVKPTVVYHGSGFPHVEDRGLIIPINAQRIFDRLHLNARIESIGTSMHMFSKLDHQGNLFGQVNYKELANIHGYPAYGVKKKDLLQLLEDSLGDETQGPKVAVRRNIRVESLVHQKGEKGLQVMATLQNAEGKRMTMPYDFVISGEGDISRVRDLLWSPEEVAQKVAFTRYFALVERPKSFPMHGLFEMWGPGSVLGGHSIGDEFFLWGVYKPESAPDPKQLYTVKRTEEFLERFGNFQGPFRSLVPILKKREYMHVDHPLETIVTSSLVSNRVALIGRAGRGIAPLVSGHDLGQSIEDAITVAECLTFKSLEYDVALRKYATARKARGTHVQRIAAAQASAALTAQQDWRMKLKYYLVKLDNSTKRLTEKENDLIGFDMERLKGRI